MLKQIKNKIVASSNIDTWNLIKKEFQFELIQFLIDGDIEPFLEALTFDLVDYSLTIEDLTAMQNSNLALELPNNTVGLGVGSGNLISEDGWVLKYKNGEFIPHQKETIRRSGENLLTINSSDYVDYILDTINIQSIGLYKISIGFSYSLDATNKSFVANFSINNKFITEIENGEILKIEPKDANGNDIDGRGTDQKLNFYQTYFVSLNSIGNKEIKLSFLSTSKGAEASMWDGVIEIEKY